MMRKFLSLAREAVSGSSRDFTRGSLGVALFLLAVPMVLEMLMESAFAIVDIFVVAKLGADSVAVVGLTESMMAIVFALAMGLSVAATATVARRVGEGDPDGAGRAATHAIVLGAGISLLLSAVGLTFAPTFLGFLGAEPQVVALGTPFTRLMLGGNGVVMFLFLLNAIFRGAGDASVAMRVLFCANLINILLAPSLVLGPGVFAAFHIPAPAWLVGAWPFPALGVTGAALATNIGRGVGVLLAASYLLRADGRITLHRPQWKIEPHLLQSMIKIAAPAMLQFLIGTASWSVLVRVVAGFGSQAIAGYIIGLRLIIFALLPAMGLSNAAATLVGQNLGAKNPERAEKSVWLAARINALVLGAIGLLLWLFSGPIVAQFTQEIAVASYARHALHTVALGFVFYGVGMVLGAAFNGAGDSLTPTILNLGIFWVFEIPLAYVLAYHFKLGPAGVFWAITVAFSVLAFASAFLFRRGRWKTQKV